MLSPGGVTLDAVNKMKEVKKELNRGYGQENGVNIEIEPLLLHEFVANEMYPAIKRRYEDEEGSFGTGFLRDTIRPLCHRIINPKPWIQKLTSIQKLVVAKYKEKAVLQGWDNPRYMVPGRILPLDVLVDTIDEIDRIDLDIV